MPFLRGQVLPPSTLTKPDFPANLHTQRVQAAFLAPSDIPWCRRGRVRETPDKLTLRLIFLAQLWEKGQQYHMLTFGCPIIDEQILAVFGPWDVPEVPAAVDDMLALARKHKGSTYV